MTGLGDLLQKSYAAAIPTASAVLNAAPSADAEGLKAYADDMVTIRAVLSTSTEPVPWGIVILVTLLLLGWLAALTAAWIHLNRRSRRLATPVRIDTVRTAAT
ncbi:MAG: hypothetical protein P4L83_10750 [Nevskia sp.]|nr:hypothetical protein [Nevskia sp.]